MNHVAHLEVVSFRVSLICSCGDVTHFDTRPTLTEVQTAWRAHVLAADGWVHVPDEAKDHYCEPPRIGLNRMPTGSIWQCGQCGKHLIVESRPGDPNGKGFAFHRPPTDNQGTVPA